MSNPATIWIVDRDPRHRAAMARLAGIEHHSVLGAPEDSCFNSAALPRVVIVGLSSDCEAELDFVHRLRSRVGDCGWILIAQPGDNDEPQRLFDTLDARLFSWPPPASDLRRTIRSLLRMRDAAPLSQRTGREALSARFARWFSGDELHWLLRTLDPSLASVPILVRGEAGTGRRLLARYIHAFGSEPGAAFVPVFCEGVETAGQLLKQLDIEGLHAEGQPPPRAITIWLDAVDRLPTDLQRRLHGWVDFGLPAGSGLSHLRIRWTASAGEEASEQAGQQLEVELSQALSGLVVRLAPLREQPAAIERFVHNTVDAWCEEHRSRPREFDAKALQTLLEFPWPGNLRELEGVVTRTLAGCGSQTVTPQELRFDTDGDPGEGPLFGAAPAPAPASEVFNAVLEAAPISFTERDPEAQAAEMAHDAAPTDASEPTVEGEFEPHELAEFEPAVTTSVTELDAEIVSDLGETAPPVEVTRAIPDDSWAQILRSVAHEVRNPLVSIRTFSELLPEHHDDSDFRARFAELVGADVRRIEEVVNRLQELSELSDAKCQPVDIANLLDELLEERRNVVEARQLLVLKELDQSHPIVLGDPQLLRAAFGGIFNRALEWVPERGDLYLASRHRQEGPGEDASVRILLRFQGTSAAGQPGSLGSAPTLAESTLEFVAAHAVILGQGGAFTFDATDRETVVVVDLPAPPAAAVESRE